MDSPEEEILEFNVAHNRRYSSEHVWFQEKDEKLMIGISEYFLIESGDALRVILPQQDSEVDIDGALFSIWTADGKFPIPSPFDGIITEVNGEVEQNPELINDSTYDLGWVVILEPHNYDEDQLLDPDEYVEYIAEL